MHLNSSTIFRAWIKGKLMFLINIKIYKKRLKLPFQVSKSWKFDFHSTNFLTFKESVLY